MLRPQRELNTSHIQIELIDIQCSDTLKAKYDPVGAAEFARFIPDTMPQLLRRYQCLAAHTCANNCSLWRS